MPKYQYNVINRENKSLSGTISAQDEKSARAELNQLGFSVIGINEIPETQGMEQEGPQLPTFEFSGIDKNQKRVTGTIQAEDRFSAYKRLISEYAFEVEYLVDQALPEGQKTEEKIKGVFELQNRIDEESLALQKKSAGAGENVDLKEFEKKQEVLKLQVEFVLKKVKEMLDLYEQEMKPEIKEQIRKYVDKILRIKSSTNLDYIRKSCEELLSFLQKEEIFLHEEARMKERTQLVLEAKSMMMQLHSSKSKSSMGINESLRRWREDHIISNDQPTFFEKLQDFLIGIFIGFVPENNEVVEIQHNIAIVQQQIRQYWVIYFQAATPEYKNEARTSLKKLRQERKKLRRQMKEAKKRLREEFKKQTELTGIESLSRELLNFTGWLLAFYLLYYFVSIYAGTKQVGALNTIPLSYSLYKTSFLKYFLTTLFLFHSALSVKINLFRRNEAATLVITPVFLLSTILILLNF